VRLFYFFLYQRRGLVFSRMIAPLASWSSWTVIGPPAGFGPAGIKAFRQVLDDGLTDLGLGQPG